MMNDPKTGLFYRDGTYDLEVIREATRCYADLTVKGRVVMDVGGNIGVFAHQAAKAGATEVHTYEPDASNFGVLVLNVAEFQTVRTYEAALVSGDAREIKFYLTAGINKGSHTMVPTRGRIEVTVAALKFQTELARIRPQVIKMDCEGAEYELLLGCELPDSVREIALELHLNRKDWRAQAVVLIAQLEAQKFRAVKHPKVGGKNWHTVGVWKR